MDTRAEAELKRRRAFRRKKAALVAGEANPRDCIAQHLGGKRKPVTLYDPTKQEEKKS